MVELIVIFVTLLPSGATIHSTKNVYPITSPAPGLTDMEYCQQKVIPNEIKIYTGKVEILSLSCMETKERESV